MFSRIGYVLRETGASLKRNFTLTAASLLTVAVSLTLVGGSLLVQRAVNNTTGRWQDGVQVIVFMKPDATQDQIAAVGRNLTENPQVKEQKFYDQQQAYAEMRRLFPDTPELVDTLSPAQMPTSYRVVPTQADRTLIDSIGRQVTRQPGVYEVSYAKDAVDWIRTISQFLYWGFLGAAAVLGIGAVMLIWNTTRTAMFARRREIEVMKLVGATNWFIRVPFMLEGLIQGLIGAVLACFGIWTLNSVWTSKIIGDVKLVDLQALQVTGGEFRAICVLLLVGGAVVGAIGSGIAVTRFLDV